ncbi:unnamed protein product [Cuscuta epithymum]|uniref:Uncharacterized protein n=1 Tax=Cuscuta epithymum TaxID=186058 RepID=A0AAV0CGV5_9ASTE|nr:unnamed protein product [Cuscuta epithymum]
MASQVQSTSHVTGNKPNKDTLSFTWADLLRSDNDKSIFGAPATGNNLISVDSSPCKRITQLSPKDALVTADELETFYFYGEEGFDSIKIESKVFKFAVTNQDIIIFEINKSILCKIDFDFDLAPHIIRFIFQLTRANHPNYRQKRRFGLITVSSGINKSGRWLKISKEKGSSILIPMGPHNSNLKDFLAIFSNFVGLTNLIQEIPMHLENEPLTGIEETISKLIFNFEVQRAYVVTEPLHSSEKQAITPQMPQNQAYSDASDNFDYSDDSFYTDDFLGHATESDRRPPISYPNEIRKSKFNSAICRKANSVTSENCLPTDNLNTQLKIYRKSQKNKRRHSMRTRSQSRDFPWE